MTKIRIWKKTRKNAYMLLARQLQGLSMKELSKRTKISLQTLYRYEDFRGYPKDSDIIKRLETVLKVPESYLFSEEYKAIIDDEKSNTISLEDCYGEFALDTTTPEVRYLIGQLFENINFIFSTLKDREVIAIKRHIMSEETLEDIGLDFGVSGERIRQIVYHALRKIRHPSRSRYINHFYTALYRNEF